MAVNIPSPFFKSSSAFATRHIIDHYQAAAVTVATLKTFVAPFRCEIGQIVASCGGAGAGITVLDVLVSHINLATGVYDTPTSIWTTAANRPTMPAAGTGVYSLAKPDRSATSYGCALNVGDIVSITGASVGAGGSTLLSVSIALHIRG
jgi:hypothetical protein